MESRVLFSVFMLAIIELLNPFERAIVRFSGLNICVYVRDNTRIVKKWHAGDDNGE